MSATHLAGATPTPTRREGDLDLELGRRTVWVPVGRAALPVAVRSVVVVVVLAALAAVLAVVAIGTGEIAVAPPEVVAALLGQGHPADQLVVREWRAPRAVMALALGAVLGLGGAIFQSLTRNPLGSPDVIGFATGAYTGAIIVMLVLHGGFVATALGSLTGGILTALAVYLLAVTRTRSGRSADGFRLIIVGIGVAALLSALNTWIMLRSQVEDAMRVAIWGAGSLTGLTWAQAVPSLGITVVLGLAAAVLSRRLHILEMGDDAAAALGVRVEPTRLVLMAVGVATVALCSATAGPISFVALAAPQIARRLTRSAGIALLPAALTGSGLLLLADIVAQRIHPESPIPVGVVTVSIGGVYLVWLLLREGRKRR